MFEHEGASKALLISILTSLQLSCDPLSTLVANNLALASAVPCASYPGVRPITIFCLVTGTGAVLSATVIFIRCIVSFPQQSDAMYLNVVTPHGTPAALHPLPATQVTVKP